MDNNKAKVSNKINGNVKAVPEVKLGDGCLLATSKSGTHWEPRDQGLDGGLVSSLRALL